MQESLEDLIEQLVSENWHVLLASSSHSTFGGYIANIEYWVPGMKPGDPNSRARSGRGATPYEALKNAVDKRTPVSSV